MGDLHFPAELPIQAIRDLVDAVRSGDYTSAATVDHALWALGCVNALRGPQPFGAVPDGGVELNDLDLCNRLEAELPAGFGSSDDAESLPPIVVTLLFELASRVLRRLFNR